MTELKDKKEAFSRGIPEGFVNRLFFQARNLAIESMMLRIETILLRQGFNVRCVWNESSFSAPTIGIRMYNPKPGAWEYGACTIHLIRERISAPDEVSNLFYALKSVQTTEYWPRKQPQQLLDFRAAVAALESQGHFAAEIAKVNYPFDYARHSSF